MKRTAHSEALVRAWAERQGWSLRVLNGGHRWLIQKPEFMAEWWPSSATLAINRDYSRSQQAAHWAEVQATLQAQSGPGN